MPVESPVSPSIGAPDGRFVKRPYVEAGSAARDEDAGGRGTCGAAAASGRRRRQKGSAANPAKRIAAEDDEQRSERAFALARKRDDTELARRIRSRAISRAEATARPGNGIAARRDAAPTERVRGFAAPCSMT